MNQFEDEFERENAEFEQARFEAELTLAMQHVDAPEGFAARVLAKAAEPAPTSAPQKAKVILMMPRRVQAWVGGAIAVALLVGAFGVRVERERHERAEEAAQAQQQYEQALQITGQTLDHVRAQLEQAGVPVGD